MPPKGKPSGGGGYKAASPTRSKAQPKSKGKTWTRPKAQTPPPGPAWADKNWQTRAKERGETRVPAPAPNGMNLVGNDVPYWKQALMGMMPQVGAYSTPATMGMQQPRTGAGKTWAGGFAPTSTVLPDTFAAQQEAFKTYIRPPWWNNQMTAEGPMTPQRQLSRQVYRDRGTIARPRSVKNAPAGYTEPLIDYGAQDDGGGYGGGYGGGNGYTYPDFGSYGGGGAYAQPQGRGYNPENLNTPRWWHNRLSWRF